MNFVQRCIGLAVVVSWSSAGPALVHGQDWGEASSLYSQGVHAFFAGRSSDAESFLSRALASETRDPRPYYFRALSLMRLGRMDEARGDMMLGANLEAQRPGRYPIGSTLERVQGSHRLLLERYRQQARAGAATNRAQLRRERYPRKFRADADVLRQRIVIPLDEFLRPGGPRPIAAEELGEFDASAPQSGVAGPAEMRPTPQSAADDPFRDDDEPERDLAPAPAQPTPSSGEAEETAPADEPAPESEPAPEADADDEDPFSEL